MTDWDDEVDLALLEAACAQAEASYQASSALCVTSAATASTAQPTGQAPQPDATVVKRKLPASLTGGDQGGGGGNMAPSWGEGPSKRKLPGSLTCPAEPQQQLPLLRYEGPCQYLFTAVEVDGVCELLCSSGLCHCGFDIEWQVTYETGVAPRPVALVQLCLPQPTPQHYRCLLLHVARSGVTPHLRQLLCCKDILKVGVGAHGDALKVQRDFGFEMAGVLDLSEFANMRLCRDGQLPQKWSLAGLAERLLGQTLAKAQQLRCSDWERHPLTVEQREYAAADVFASLRVYEIMEKMPVVWQPAAPLAQLPLPLGEGAAAAVGLVPTCAQLARLQPAKLQVYTMHMQQGLTVQEIAAARRTQEDSTQGYLAEAIVKGYAYCWPRLGVPEATLRQVAEVAGRLLERQLSCELPAAVAAAAQQPQQACMGQHQEPAAGGRGQRQEGPWAAAAAGAVPGLVGGGPAHAAGTAPGEHSSAAGSGGGDGSSPQPVDVLVALLATGAKIRELKEEHWPEVPYGHLRLALAHLGRCNPGPWECGAAEA